MTAPNVVSFYADSHHGNAFGIKGPSYGPAGHRGDDTNGWAVGTIIPSISDGVVERSERQVQLGWVVSVKASDGMHFGYCHMNEQGLPVGAVVKIGSPIGPLGTTGTQSLGPHVHVTASKTGTNPSTAAVIDPRPYIVAARTAFAGGGGTPIDNATERNSMTTLYWDGQASPNATWALGGDSPGTTANWIETKDQGLANKWAAVHGAAVDCGSAANFGQFRSWYQQPLKVVGGTPGGGSGTPTDESGVIAAINALVPHLDAITKAALALNPPG